MTWKQSPDRSFRVRTWDNECIIFDESSSDIHLVDFLSGSLFGLLSIALTLRQIHDQLRTRLEIASDILTEDRIVVCLTQLEQAGLICRVAE